MDIRANLRRIAFKKGYLIEKLSPITNVKNFISQFKDKYVSCELIRVGSESDGGYLHPNLLKTISYCFSPGVAYQASFEKELSEKFKIKSFMADASVKEAPLLDDNFEFIPKFLGTYTKNEFITLTDWIKQSKVTDEDSKILQMDIEGAEFDVLLYESAEILASFSTLIIEFHRMERMFQKDFLYMLKIIFEKIYKNFSICHVHPNNCCGIYSLNGVDVPRVMEVTFVRNDLINSVLSTNPIHLPHSLDRKNLEDKRDLVMPEMWWRK